jgi:hypothetical protein
MANTNQSFLLKNQSAGTYPLNPSGQSRWAGSGGVLGGLYSFETVSTGTGTIQLEKIGADGSTLVPVGASVTTTGSYQTLYLPPGSYSVTITGFTANYASLVRVPV